MAFVFTLAALVGCERVEGGLEPDTNGWEEQEIVIPTDGYIFFNAGISTRATLLSSFPKEDFGVIGYRYQGGWGAVKAVASQNSTFTYADPNTGEYVDARRGVFGPDATPGQITVGWNGSYYDYSPHKSWISSLNYAFFAWYPNNFVANDGNANYEGDPYIKYTLPDSRSEMVDLMTACELNYTKSKGPAVPLQMGHRLSALDLRGTSLVTAASLADDVDFTGIDTDANVELEVTSLSVTLDKIATQATFSLNTVESGVTHCTPSNYQKKTFDGFVGESVRVQRSEIRSLVAIGDHLILIPQNESITATVTASYTISCDGKSKNYNDMVGQATISNLAEGSYHYLLITFSKSGIFVEENKGTSWEALVEVEHTFE